MSSTRLLGSKCRRPPGAATEVSVEAKGAPTEGEDAYPGEITGILIWMIKRRNAYSLSRGKGPLYPSDRGCLDAGCVATFMKIVAVLTIGINLTSCPLGGFFPRNLRARRQR